ncbi:MAG: class F sortase [Nitriliruptoraceae bacterium]
MSRSSLAAVIVGASLLIGAPLGWQLSQPQETVGDLATVEPTTSRQTDDSPEVSVDTEAAPRASERSGAGANQEEEPPTPDPVAAPTRIQIPSIGVDAPVDAIGLEDDGAMEIPDDIDRVGWYEPGVGVGESRGTAVLSGHVDSRTQGQGAFFELRTLDVEETITVDHEDGTSSEWTVVARTSYPKDELPIEDIFTRFSDPRLVLITCGGAFDNTERSYADNVVVYAEPADPGVEP